MVEKLRSVLGIIQLRLILKSFIFAGLLFWIKASQFSVLSILVFVAIGLVLYFRNHTQNNLENIYSFLALLLVSILSVGLLSHAQFILPAIFFFAGLFYLTLGIKEFSFIRRYEWNTVKNILLIYSIFLVYFMFNQYTLFYLKYLAIFVIFFFLINEWLFWLEPAFPKRYKLVSFVFSFLVLQVLWAVSILPLGFLISASLMTLFVYVLFDSCEYYFKGTLTKDRILKNIIIFVISLFVIYFSTNWKI